MKISETTSYPHPVLAPWSEDIAHANFTADIAFREEAETTQVSLHCTVTLSQSDIEAMIVNGSAAFGCFIKCRETGFRRLQRIGYPSGRHDFAPGALLGRVQIRPIIWSLKPIQGYHPAGAHSEFGDGSDVTAGQILALDDESIIDVTHAYLAPIESIFEIVSSDDVVDGRFEINAEADRIAVTMSKKTFELVQHLRAFSDGSKTAVMNALYAPVIMQILDLVRDGFDQFDQYRWLHPFRARCELADIKIEKLDLINDAQKLLALPFSSLVQLIDLTEED